MKHFNLTLSRALPALLGLLLLAPSSSRADEGMWMTRQLSPATYLRMKEMGFKMNPLHLYNSEGTALQGAVVLFGGFCTGVVVSHDGLVLTNHHCGFASIQQHSTPEHDYLKNGFCAATREEEWPVPGLYVSFPVRTDCVSDRVLPLLSKKAENGAVSQIWGKRREQIIDSLQNVMDGEVVKEDPTLRADLVSYFGGNEFYLNVYRDYTDIRLVLAPPLSAGKFGGDTDNWMWPRQTCDFSMFRIYADNGQPADFKPTNTPLKPRSVAPISIKGWDEGSFVMTMGFPGSTSRYLSSYGIEDRVNSINTPVIKMRTLKQMIWREAMEKDPAVRLKYDTKYAQSSNFWKNSIGMNRCLAEQDVLVGKRSFEKNLQEWIESDGKTRQRYGHLLDDLKRAYDETSVPYRNYYYACEAFMTSCDLLTLGGIYSWLTSPITPEKREVLKDGLREFFRNFDAPTDQRTLAAMMSAFRENVVTDAMPAIYQTIDRKYHGSFSAYTEDLYRRTLLSDSSLLLAALDGRLSKGKVKKLLADPMVTLWQDIHKTLSVLRQRAGTLRRNEPERRLMQAIREMYATSAHYPDANMTLRFSYGTMRGYTPDGGTPYPFFTTPQSLKEKVDMQEEKKDYFMEPSLISLLSGGDYGRYGDKGKGTMPLCFITDNDITGGNSGSPMFNGDGEVIGLAFDGNWESMANDIQYNPSLTRCIGVDIRYVLFMIDKWAGARRLVDEMSIRQ